MGNNEPPEIRATRERFCRVLSLEEPGFLGAQRLDPNFSELTVALALDELQPLHKTAELFRTRKHSPAGRLSRLRTKHASRQGSVSDLDRKLQRLAELEALQGKCRRVGAEGPCRNAAGEWGLCERHVAEWQRKFIETFKVEPTKRPQPTPVRSPLFEKPHPSTAEEARARIDELLSLRQRVPDPNEAYTIPFGELSIKGRRATGPSLVEGDEPVNFRYFVEKTPGSEELVVAYSEQGPHAGKDMPLASRRLFKEIMECLKLLPGYIETCPITGDEIDQQLSVIAYKLLRGSITPDQVRFRRFSEEGKRLLEREQTGKLLALARKLMHLSPAELAKALLVERFPPEAAIRVLRRLLKGSAPVSEIEALTRSISEQIAKKRQRRKDGQ